VRIRCAWCGRAGGERAPLEDRRTTHGVCLICVERVRLNLRLRRDLAELERLIAEARALVRARAAEPGP
jgi:hypothetical protein